MSKFVSRGMGKQLINYNLYLDIHTEIWICVLLFFNPAGWTTSIKTSKAAVVFTFVGFNNNLVFLCVLNVITAKNSLVSHNLKSSFEIQNFWESVTLQFLDSVFLYCEKFITRGRIFRFLPIFFLHRCVPETLKKHVFRR